MTIHGAHGNVVGNFDWVGPTLGVLLRLLGKVKQPKHQK